MLRGDGNKYPASGCAIQFCHYQAVYACNIFKYLDLIKCVLTCGCVQRQQNRMRCGLVLLFQNANDLLKLIHQLFLVLKPTCRIHQHDVLFLGNCLIIGIKGKSGCISAIASRHDGRLCAIPPDMQLLNCGCTEGIARHQQCRKTCIIQLL